MNEKIGIVVSDTYSELTNIMLAKAEQKIQLMGAKVEKVIHVPGCYDTPIVIQHLAQKNEIDGVVVLGIVLKGETDHDQIVAHNAARGAMEVSLKYNKPITNGISGPKMTRKQAIMRMHKFGADAAEACVKLIRIMQ